MNLLPALVVGLTAGFLAVQDLKGEKKEPEEKAVEAQTKPTEEEMDEYEEIVNDEYLNITMEDDLSEIMGEDFEEEDEDEEVAEGESIHEITENEVGIFNFDRVDLMYFTEDRILCDGDMVTIDNVDEWLGNVDLETQSDEITVKWIRNFNLPYDIRLEIIGDAYSGSH